MAKFILYTHNKPQVTTVGDFLKSDSAASLVLNMTSRQLIEYENNGESIFSQYISSLEIKENNDKIQANNDDKVTLKPGTALKLPVSNLNRNSLFKANDNVVRSSQIKPFLAKELTNLLRDPGYKQELQISGGGGRLITDHIKITAVLYSKVLDKFINISPFVSNIATSVGQQGGSWSAELSALRGKYTEGEGWKIDSNISKNGETTSVTPLHIDGKRTSFYFPNVISENDVIFIKYTDLPMEKESEKFSSESLPYKVWDMIGLVDSTRLSTDDPTNLSISVRGRDMMKLLIEDGSYFFPGALKRNIFANEPDGSITERSLVDGKLYGFFSYYFRGILDTLQFVISKFSTTGMVPDHVFQAWGARRSTRFKMPTDTGESVATNEPQKGVWAIIRLLVDESVSKRLIVDRTIAQEQGSMINSINKICQEPFVEFSGDTYGDVYVFKANKLPFDKIGYTGMTFDGIEESNFNFTQKEMKAPPSFQKSFAKRTLSSIVIDIDESEVLNDSLEFDDEAYSWYRIIPKASLGKMTDSVVLEYLPAISFERYAQIWGSRVNAIETNYINYIPVDDSKSLSITETVTRQAVEDLRYMVQASAYLPFSRRGGITIHLNRLIKRGTMIYYKPTDEIFFVDQVNHSVSMTDEGLPDGTTTLTVTRGLKREYVRGKNGISYFDIISTNIPANYDNARDVLKTWQVNDEVFDFFLKRRQFAQ